MEDPLCQELIFDPRLSSMGCAGMAMRERRRRVTASLRRSAGLCRWFPFMAGAFARWQGCGRCRAGSRRAPRPLRGLRSARVALAGCGSAVRLRRRLAGWPRGLRRSSWRGVGGHLGVGRVASPPSVITVRGCPRPRPRRVCVPTRAGAREAVDGRAVTGRHRAGGAAHGVAGSCRGAPAGGRPPAARPATLRAWSVWRARPGRARAAGSRPSCGPCRTRPSGR